ncbi:MAG: heparin binding hemagglutinin HbhA [Pseudonocardiales bacterium]|nr:heparin binding hemagglutinin HbhA [Pseudonocardiales bacterium]
MAFSAPPPGDHRTTAEPGTPVEQPRNPLLVALGAGDAAVAAVARAFADAVEAATSTQKTVQQRVSDLPAELEELRGRFSSEELRRALELYRAQVERAYVEFAGRGEEAWERLRERANTERIARAGQRFTGRTADTVVEASAAAADAVESVGTATAEVIEDAGAETAAATRTATNGRSGAATPRRAPRPGGPASG